MTLLYTVNLTDNIVRLRAPPGFSHRIDAVNFSNKTALAAAFMYIIDRWFPVSIVDTVGVNVSNVIASMDLTIAGQNHFVDSINQKSKYLTVAKTDAGTSNCVVSIYGDFVKATRTELIVEWLRRFS